MRRQLYIDLIGLYSRVRRRPWGVLLYNPKNPTYYEANGARAICTDEPESAVEEIVRFYRTRRLMPRATLDEATVPPDLPEWLEATGWECGRSRFHIMGWTGRQEAPSLPDGVTISGAGRRDLDALVSLQAEADPWSRPQWLRSRTAALLASLAVRCYLVRQDGLPVASALLFQGSEAGLIESVVTHPAHRRRGLASALLRQIQSDAGTPLLLSVLEETVAQLYVRLGFTIWAEAEERHCWLPGE